MTLPTHAQKNITPSPTLPSAFKKQALPSRQSYGTYLYLKNTTFYFRYVFSTQQKVKLGKSEIRISLKTGFLKIAKKKARELCVSLEKILLKNEPTCTYETLKKELTQKLEKMLDKFTTKREPSIQVIKERMQALLQHLIYEADDELYRPKGAVVYDENIDIFPTDPKHWLNFNNEMMSIPLGSSEELLKYDYPNVIIELLKNKIFHFDEITVTSIPKILNEYRKTHINFNNIMLARENKDFAYEKQLLDTAPVTYNISLVAPKVDTKNEANCQNDVNNTTISEKACKHNNLLLSEFVEKYVQTKLSDRKWKEHSVADHKNRLNSLQSILGDIPIQDITREEFRRFRDSFAKLPPNYMKASKYKDKSVDELLLMTHAKTYSIKTVNITVEAVASMFEWGVREGYLEKNNAKSLQINDDRQDISLKDAFTPEDIQKIFFSGDYTPESFLQPAYYWAPLIALYTGMRLEEICQLSCSDIKKENEIWYIDVNTHTAHGSREIKILKNKNASRQIPIHQNLLNLGLLEYVEQAKKEKHERIFPELKKTANTQKYGKNVGRFFSRYIKRFDLIHGNKSFHSLRHSFSQYFKEKNLHSDAFRQIFGHGIGELASRQYGNKFSVKYCYDEIISKLSF